MRFRGLTVTLLLLLAGLALSVRTALADPRVETEVDFEFGERLIVEATFQEADEIAEARIFLRPEAENRTRIAPLDIDFDGRARYVHDLREDPFPPFSNIHVWYQLTLRDGEEVTMASESRYYFDDRHDWESLESDHFVAHWYEGDVVFAQQVIDRAEEGLDTIGQMLGIEIEERWNEEGDPAKVAIYVYASATELQSALLLGSPTWVAGHANPELRVVLVSLNPEDVAAPIEMDRQIPHETAHIMLHKLTGIGYVNLPAWLNEGIASFSELDSNPDYRLFLRDAYQSDSLIPIESLCHGFPRDASHVLLAYAQSESLTGYLIDHHGTSGLKRLISEYADGKSCTVGAQAALGLTLDQLERAWRQDTFAENVLWLALEEMSPYLFLLGAMIAPLLTVAVLGRKGRSPSRPEQAPLEETETAK